MGPPLVAIAEKYRGQSGALDASVRRVREGSTGVWGQVPMLPHPQHTTDEVTLMLRWVFGLEKGKGGPAIMRGLAGEVIAPNPEKAGEFILEATYADAGRAPAGSLSGTARVALRSLKSASNTRMRLRSRLFRFATSMDPIRSFDFHLARGRLRTK